MYIIGACFLLYAGVVETDQEMINMETNFAFCVFVSCYVVYKTCYRHSLDLLTLSIQASRNKAIGLVARKAKDNEPPVPDEIPLPALIEIETPLADTVLLSR